MEYTIWIIFMAVMLVVEASTTTLVSIWFALGALGAIAAKALGAVIYVQILVFIVVSTIAVLVAWPLIKKQLEKKTVATNYDMIIGRMAVVTDEISSDKFAGTVRIAGKDWSAVTEDGDTVYAGEKVLVKSISGVKLVVDKIK